MQEMVPSRDPLSATAGRLGYVQFGSHERTVIVRTGPSAAAQTPTSVALMKLARCRAIVDGVSSAKQVFPIAVLPMWTQISSLAANVPPNVTVACENDPPERAACFHQNTPQ